MPIRDNLLNVSPEATDLPLIATDRMSALTIDLEGTPTHGMAVRVNIEWSHGTTDSWPTLTLVVHGASSTPVSTSDPILATLVITPTAQIGQVERIIPFVTNHRYVRVEFDTAGTATDSPSFSVVEAYIVENVGFDWDRNVNFH